MKITFISDTHGLHDLITPDLPGGDILIHAGDSMNHGRHRKELESFINWFDKIDNYEDKIFIAGNHDRLFESYPERALKIIEPFLGNITYLQDSLLTYEIPALERFIKIYGSPWQPEFCNWAFNLPREGIELHRKWEQIPLDTDILITHGPPQEHLDVSDIKQSFLGHLGCPLLRVKVDNLIPKIHIFGHIHGSYGYKFHNGTHFINASSLNERYEYTNKPLNADWDPQTNELNFL